MKIVYASRTGNTEYLVTEELGITDALKIESGDEEIKEPYILFTYTDGSGDVPFEVESFLQNNGQYIKGVIACGDRGYGDDFAKSGDKISEQYNVPCLYKVENTGTDEDIEAIKKILAEQK